MLRAKRVVSRRLPTGSLRPALVGDAMITMMMMTTCLSLVAVGEVPTIRLLEPAQVLGLPSPHGTSKTIFTKIYVLDQSLCQLRTHRLFCISPCAYGLLIIRICTVCTVFGYFTHLCPLGEVVCCHLLSLRHISFGLQLHAGLFFAVARSRPKHNNGGWWMRDRDYRSVSRLSLPPRRALCDRRSP